MGIEEAELGLGFHALGAAAHVQRMDHVQHRAHDGVRAPVLAQAPDELAIELHLVAGETIGERARALAGRLGGREAEPLSHLQAACEAIGQLWSTNSVRPVREPATGLILERLIRERDDWRRLIRAVESFASNIAGLQEYVRGWARGHFLPGYC